MLSALAGSVATPVLAATQNAQSDHRGHDDHDDGAVEGPLSSATVSFGAWSTEPPLDRFPNLNINNRNVHKLFPFEARIKAGGSVNFVIAGFHHILIYAPGTKFEEINGTLTAPIPGAPDGFPAVVNDPVNRVYRGLSPFGLPQDRVETVQLVKPGRYLAVCGFVPHFNDRMFGYIRVLR
jgi:hypothetical protein